MARIVVAGGGATGASVAFHLASLGAREVVLADRGRVAGGATAKAMGGVRQQFSTAAEVRLAQHLARPLQTLHERGRTAGGQPEEPAERARGERAVPREMGEREHLVVSDAQHASERHPLTCVRQLLSAQRLPE